MPVELRSDAQRRIAKCDCDDKDDNLARKRKSFRRCKIKTTKRHAGETQVQRNQQLKDYKVLALTKSKANESEATFFPPPPPPKLTRRQRRHHLPLCHIVGRRRTIHLCHRLLHRMPSAPWPASTATPWTVIMQHPDFSSESNMGRQLHNNQV